MRILFSDGTLWRNGGRLRLVKTDQGWRIVGPGYFCAVESREEGRTVIAELLVRGKKRGVAIEFDH